ncbi:MAG: aminotransferase class V-fold PLP-dependent enzyme [Deltaproteobacteria bacterium]|nr:aminotransferase class V-fold PLP-dependent enzyme [Deltaproteobacteria bacterium]
MRRVYLDHHAATPLLPAARDAMLRAHELGWANASSAHHEGRAARAMLEDARRAVAGALGASAADIVLTGGGTEAGNLGVLGLAGEQVEDLVVITSSIEHPAVERATNELARRGATVHALDLHGSLAPLRDLVARPIFSTARCLLAVQAVSHETGSTIDVVSIASMLPKGASVFVDASAALGKLSADRFVRHDWAVAIAGAKIGASAGAGALLVPRSIDVTPRQLGGAHERGRRAGTPDVAAHTALGLACRALGTRLQQMPRIAVQRDRLEAALVALGGVVNGAETERVATVTNVSFHGWRKSTLVAALDLEGIAVSAGAACSSGLDGPSPVVRALHPDEPWRSESCVRFSLGIETSDEDIDLAVAAITRVLARRAG